jgi:ABC-type dipeptide/oligopeptide/nickel transport system permease subunit
METIFKIALAALIVAAVALTAKRSSLFGALVASLPLTSILAMIWLYQDTRDADRVAALAMNIFWLVIPSLVLFIVLASLLRKGVAFYPSLLAASVSTVIAYGAMSWLISRFDIRA